ncbi:MAG: PEP/pyruvate-binding domain-containing protein [Syntrophaceae bacterium]|nr:PEP/pyruvate-binding domain-containing protein [Syntrophaceae bacterium]
MPSKKGTKNVIWFKNCSTKDFSQVGGKNANLGEMLRLGLRVPPGFAVTTKAFNTFIDRGRVRNEIVRTLSQIPPENIHALEEAGRQIRERIESTPIPKNIVKEIKEAYQKLGDLCGNPDIPVAVRSSATSEDTKMASFAGLHDSYLWVRGEGEVVQYVLKCWASLFTDRVIAYRNQIGWPHDKVTISVGVQKMVNAKCAGVMFTIDPIMGDANKIVVEGNWGLGESVVKGEVSPDHFLVDKQTSEILEKNCAQKLVCYQLEGNKVVCRPPSPEKQNQLCLKDEELVEIVRLGKISETHYQSAQDLEWAIDVDLPFPENVFLVQTRPVTSAGKPKQSNTDIIIDMMSSLFRR